MDTRKWIPLQIFQTLLTVEDIDDVVVVVDYSCAAGVIGIRVVISIVANADMDVFGLNIQGGRRRQLGSAEEKLEKPRSILFDHPCEKESKL